MAELGFLPGAELKAMQAAGDEILECYRVLEKTSTNIVARPTGTSASR